MCSMCAIGKWAQTDGRAIRPDITAFGLLFNKQVFDFLIEMPIFFFHPSAHSPRSTSVRTGICPLRWMRALDVSAVWLNGSHNNLVIIILGIWKIVWHGEFRRKGHKQDAMSLMPIPRNQFSHFDRLTVHMSATVQRCRREYGAYLNPEPIK